MALKATVVDVSANSTTIYTGEGVVYGACVNTVLSAHTLPIQDNTSALFSFAASAAVGSYVSFPDGVPFKTSLVVDPNDAATGAITVFWSPTKHP